MWELRLEICPERSGETGETEMVSEYNRGGERYSEGDGESEVTKKITA